MFPRASQEGLRSLIGSTSRELFLKGKNLNYKFRVAAKGLLRTIFCVKLF